MIRRNRKTRNYTAPSAKVTHMALESNFCKTVRFLMDIEVDPLENVNAAPAEDIAGEYFDPIES